MKPQHFEKIVHTSMSSNHFFAFRWLAESIASLLPYIALSAFLASTFWLFAAAPAVGQNPGKFGSGEQLRPGDDFYRYANREWLETATIPAGQASYDSRAMLMEKTSQRVRDIIQNAAASQALKGSNVQKVGDYYSSLMDEEGIEAKKLEPLADEMASIAAITNKRQLSAYLGTTLNGEVDGLVTNADHVFGLWVNQGFEDADHNLVHLWQGGLGMSDRENYLEPSPKMVELRAKYQAHVSRILNAANIADSEAKAAGILSLETRIAQAFAPDADAADVFKQSNLWKRADFAMKAPGIDWSAYFESAGLAHQSDFIVWQPSAVIGVSALVGAESIERWRDYLSFHLIDHYASVLPKTIAAEHAAFYGKNLPSVTQEKERSTLAIAATNAALGQAVGQLYAEQYFPPEAKARAQDMVIDLISAFRGRISNAGWMSPETKAKALAKLAALQVIVGYPDKWIDYSTLDVVRGDALGNMRRAETFLRSRNLAKLNEPVNPIEWPINPQIPGAVIMFSPNAEFFSAGILQPPYFDPHGDTASNYGSAGAGMAHEITHSFDELGNIYDEKGRLGNWWTEADRVAYHAAAANLVAQMNGYCPLPGLCVNGNQVMTESIADLAGVLVAHDAYVLSLKGKGDVVIGGLSGEQRFFLAFARRWRKIQSEDALRSQIATDTHPPGEYRSYTVRNVDAWYQAFGVVPGDKLYVKPDERARIW